MPELDIEKFDPTVAELQAIVEKNKSIDVSGLVGKALIAVVKPARIECRDARIKIKDIGKSLRDDANAFKKAVLTKEKELLGIIEPEEERLQAIEDQAQLVMDMEKRRDQLPERKQRLAALEIGEEIDFDDSFLLTLDTLEFENYYNERVAERNRRVSEKQEQERLEASKRLQDEREAFESEKRAVEAEKLRLAHESDAREREERARAEEKERAEQRAKDVENERIRKVEQEKEQLRLQAEQKAKAEIEAQEKLEKAKKYQKFLLENGYTDETKQFFTVKMAAEGKIELWKLIGTFKQK